VTVTAPAPNLDLLTAARQWYDAGYCVVPSHEDGGKRPFGAWKQYQTERPTWEQVEAWLATGQVYRHRGYYRRGVGQCGDDRTGRTRAGRGASVQQNPRQGRALCPAST
jgi:hypothetical protein